ncbi:MAG: gamma-glutamyl-gamma-aminobutyrate hydrolase family protein [Eubacteriales bacterium]|nr:gamma-glutamyl-gamma-aminobutyrate hydrolase family protein [Clostridiales bacterium]MDY5836305.1 gamma-glutamyl-gamma-aminobutyrate hydrolase family protein [Eubacteriales bacterium]
MDRIKIAVPTYVYETTNYLGESSYPLLRISQDYPRSLAAAGASPFMIAQNLDSDLLAYQMSLMDALVIPGGDDLDPSYYHEEPNYTAEFKPLRDTFEWQLLDIAVQQGKPILGICRGLQILNVYFGGSLYQDIKAQGASQVKHCQDNAIRYPWHSVDIVPASHVHQALGVTETRVNSLHHQAVKDLAPGFAITARAKDGVVEAIESTSGPLRWGIQWHPEMLSLQSPEGQAIFNHFLDQVKAGL